MSPEAKAHYEAIVVKRIPREWRADIRVDEVGQLDSDSGRTAGNVYVRISTGSKLGRAQAMMSIGPYVRNDTEEWAQGWERHDNRFVFSVYGPSSVPLHKSVLDLAD